MNTIKTWQERMLGKGAFGNDSVFMKQEIADLRAAIASQAPRKALSDAEIEAMAIQAGGRWDGNTWVFEDADMHPFARAIEAASGPNAALVEALKKIERNEQVVFDEETNGDVIVSMGADDMIEIARAALAAVGVEP